MSFRPLYDKEGNLSPKEDLLILVVLLVLNVFVTSCENTVLLLLLCISCMT